MILVYVYALITRALRVSKALAVGIEAAVQELTRALATAQCRRKGNWPNPIKMNMMYTPKNDLRTKYIIMERLCTH